MTLTLPWPPSTNHLYGQIGHRRFLLPEVKAYRQTVGWLCAGKERFGKQRLKMELVAFPPDYRRHDLSNLLKATEDALVHAGIMDDDSQIDDNRQLRGPVKPGGELKVTLTSLQAA